MLDDSLLTLHPDLLWNDVAGQVTVVIPCMRVGFASRGLTAEAIRRLLDDCSGPTEREKLLHSFRGLYDTDSATELLTALEARHVIVAATRAADDPPPRRVLLVNAGPYRDQLASSFELVEIETSFEIEELDREEASHPPIGVYLDLYSQPADAAAATTRFSSAGMISQVASVGHNWLRLSPISFPGQSACFTCEWIRRKISKDAPDMPDWRGVPRAWSLDRLTEATRQVMGGLIVASVSSIFAGGGPPSLAQSTYIDLERWVFRTSSVIEVPDCPSCSSAPLPSWANSARPF